MEMRFVGFRNILIKLYQFCLLKKRGFKKIVITAQYFLKFINLFIKNYFENFFFAFLIFFLKNFKIYCISTFFFRKLTDYIMLYNIFMPYFYFKKFYLK